MSAEPRRAPMMPLHELVAKYRTLAGEFGNPVALSAFVMLYNSYQARGYLQFLGIVWSDGAKCTIRLDHGLSFMKSASIIQFNFNADTTAQVASLKTQSFNATNRLATTGTYIYLSDVQKQERNLHFLRTLMDNEAVEKTARKKL